MTNLTEQDKAVIARIKELLTELKPLLFDLHEVIKPDCFYPSEPIDTTEGEQEQGKEANPNVIKFYDKYFEKGKEWKVGEWCKAPSGVIFFISELGEGGGIFGYTQEQDNGWVAISKSEVQFCTKPTTEEIQAHLVAIAEKYIGKQVYELDKGVKRTIVANGSVRKEEWFYNEKTDTLFTLCPEDEWELNYPNNCSNPIVYQRGKWAELAPIKTE